MRKKVTLLIPLTFNDGTAIMRLEAELLKAAEELARSAESWADFSNALFDPTEGMVARAFETREDREAFARTEEYKRIRTLLEEAREHFGLVTGATPKKSGELTVRLPRSLQAALEREATVEGVSLNQLVVAKLAAQLKDLVGV
jgi:predicted HicB family RNase H-like nuclease